MIKAYFKGLWIKGIENKELFVVSEKEEKLSKDEKEKIEFLKKLLAIEGIKFEDYQKELKKSEKTLKELQHRIESMEELEPEVLEEKMKGDE